MTIGKVKILGAVLELPAKNSSANPAHLLRKLAKLADKYKFGLQKETCCIQTNLRPNQKESFRPECVVNFAQLRRVLEPG